MYLHLCVLQIRILLSISLIISVVGINRDVFLGHLPTPGEIIAFAKSSGIPLVAATGGKIVYQPWGSTSPNEVGC